MLKMHWWDTTDWSVQSICILIKVLEDKSHSHELIARFLTGYTNGDKNLYFCIQEEYGVAWWRSLHMLNPFNMCYKY